MKLNRLATVPSGHSSVPPADRNWRGPAERVAHAFDFVDRELHRPGHRRGGEIETGDAGGLEQASRRRVEAVDLAIDRLPQVAWNAELGKAGVLADRPRALPTGEHALRDELVQDADHE